MTINKELENYNPNLLKKPQIVIANKMDIDGALENLENFKKKVKDVQIFPISAIKKDGLDKVLIALADMLDKIKKEPLIDTEKTLSHVLYEFKKRKPFTITNENGVWVIRGDEVEKLLRMTRFSTDEAARHFALKLRKMGIDDALRELGCQEGDTIRILDLEFEYEE